MRRRLDGEPFTISAFGALSGGAPSSGAPVYTESLEAKASEAAQFCEGYVEP